MIAAAVTWPGVILALVTGLPATIAAIAGLLNRRSLKTANGKTVGEMVTEVHGEASVEATPYNTKHDG